MLLIGRLIFPASNNVLLVGLTWHCIHRRGRGRQSLMDFIEPDKKERLDSFGNHHRSNTDPEIHSIRHQGDKSGYNEQDDFPVLNRNTMMYERPSMNRNNQEYETSRRSNFGDQNNQDYETNRRSNYSEQNNQENNRYSGQGQSRSPRESYPDRSSRGRGGRGGERGGRMERGGRGNGGDRGNRGGTRGRGGGRMSYTSYSDLRGRVERNERFEQDDRSDFNDMVPQNRNERHEKNLSRNDRNHDHNQDRYDQSSERVDRNQRYERPNERFPGRNERHDEGSQNPGSSRQWNNSNYKKSPRDSGAGQGTQREANRPQPPTPEKQIIGDTIIISNSNRKLDLLADIPPEIMPPVTSANPSAFSPPTISSNTQHSATTERKSYSRERERRGMQGSAFSLAGKTAVQGPIPRMTDAPSKMVTSPTGVTAGSGRMAGAGQVGTGKSLTCTSAWIIKT